MSKKGILCFGAALAAVFVCGCSSDAPTQGQGVTPAQLTSELDTKLDNLAKQSPERRGPAHLILDKPVASHGTAAQKARYAELMKGVPMPQRGPMRASNLSPTSSTPGQ